MILRRTLADMILERGKEFGISRNVCNVHWHNDVVAGRMMGLQKLKFYFYTVIK